MTISLKANAAGTQGEILLNGTPVQTFNQNTLQVSGNVLAGAAQDSAPAALTRKDYVDDKQVGAWVNVSASRAFGQSYTNNSGRRKQVQMQFTGTGTVSVVAIVGGINLIACFAVQNSFEGQCIFDVPAGVTYGINGDTGSPIIQKWLELS